MAPRDQVRPAQAPESLESDTPIEFPRQPGDADTRNGYLGGIDRLARVFPGVPVALTRWVTKPAADFDGNTPRDMLARNRVDEVVRAAQALTAKGW